MDAVNNADGTPIVEDSLPSSDIDFNAAQGESGDVVLVDKLLVARVETQSITVSYDTWVVDLTHQFTPYDAPKLVEVIAQVSEVYSDDPQLTLQPFKGRGTGKFTLLFSTPLSASEVHSIPFIRKDANGDDKTIEVALTPLIPRDFGPRGRGGGGRHDGGRQEGTLVTLLNARLGAARVLQNRSFDEALSDYGTIVKPTEWQNHKGTRMLNGNRYLVMNAHEGGSLPDSVKVSHPHTGVSLNFYLRYKGKTWQCRRCGAEHVGPCPELAEFYAAKEAKAALPPHTITLISDSTLRHADSVGLKAEVACMSGAGIGELTNALRDDITLADQTQVVMVGGLGNDVLNPYYEDLPAFTQAMVAGSVKLFSEVSRRPNTKVTLVEFQHPPAYIPLPQRTKRHIVNRLFSRNGPENFGVLPIPVTCIDRDVTGHPSVKGTRQLLQMLDAHCAPGELVFNEKYCVNDRLYFGVTPMFRYGCKRCHARGQFYGDGGFCVPCRAEVKTLSVQDYISAASDLAHKEEPDFMDEDLEDDDAFPGLGDAHGEDTDSSTLSGGPSERNNDLEHLDGDLDTPAKRQRTLADVVATGPA